MPDVNISIGYQVEAKFVKTEGSRSTWMLRSDELIGKFLWLGDECSSKQVSFAKRNCYSQGNRVFVGRF